MSMASQRARVRAAEQRMKLARAGVTVPAAALLARGERRPLTMLGLAAGLGAVLGRLNIHPLRVPGMGFLLGGGLTEVAALGARMISEIGASLGRDTPPP